MNKELLAKLFKHSPDTGTGSGAGSESPEIEQSEIDSSEQEDDFQAPKSKSELDSRINKAVQAALKNAEAKHERELKEKIAAALKQEKDYSKLSEEERAQREFEDQKKALETEKAQFEHDKLVVQIEKDLVAKDLPTEFAELFAISGAEEAVKQVQVFESAFNKAVADKVKESLRQSAPEAGGRASNQSNYGASLAEVGTSASGAIF